MENEFMKELFLHIGKTFAEISSEGQYKAMQKYIKLYGNEENKSKERIKSNIIINPEDKDVVYKYFYKGLDIMTQGAMPEYLQIELDYELHRIALRSDIDDVSLRALHVVKRILIDYQVGNFKWEDFSALSVYFTTPDVRNKLFPLFKESGFFVEGELDKIYSEECEISEELIIEELKKSNESLNIKINDEEVKECIDRNIKDSRILIAQHKEIVIGTIVFKENIRQTVEKEILNYDINDMKIDKLYEGKGVAKFLIFGVYDRLKSVSGNGVKFNIIEPGSTSIIMKY
jgi:hypothetical protein